MDMMWRRLSLFFHKKTVMRILQVINKLTIGGAERLLSDIIPIMSQYHNVDVLVLQDYDSYFVEKLKNENIKVFSLGMKSVYNPLAVWKMGRFLKRSPKYDIIHVHLFPSQYWVALCKCLFRIHVPLITTEHNPTNTRFNHKLTTWTDRWVYSFYDSIICISEGVNRAMTDRVKGKVRTKTIDNGINLKLFSDAKPVKRTACSIPEDAIVLMQVARFEEQKNQDCVIRALKRLPKNVYVVFVGDGTRRAFCESLASEMGVEDRVRFLGVRSDIADLWTMADMGIMSSHWEGFGLSAVEAMAAGKPVLGTRVEGLSEVIGNPDLCFSDDDDEGLAQLIMRFVKDEEYRTRIVEYCKQRASLFSIERMVDAHILEYETVVSKYLYKTEV